MDLWDVAKLMGRRWYVALPVLVLTVAAAVATVLTVKPDYTATTNVSLLPPTQASDPKTATMMNPWDTNSLTIVTLTYLNSKRLHDEMKAEGFSDVWEADLDDRLHGLVVIEVTAPTPELSRATARRLQELAAGEVARRQARYNLKPGEEFTTIPFDDGDNIEVASSKMKRALIVVVGIGIIVTIALTVSLDAFLRWRSRPREEQLAAGRQTAVGRQAAATAATTSTVETQQPATARSEPPTEIARPSTQPARPSTETAGPTDAAQPPTGATTQPPATIAQAMRLRVTEAGEGPSRETQVIPAVADRPAADTPAQGDRTGQQQTAQPVEPVTAASDTTVVLPLYGTQWTHQTRKSGDPTAENSKR